jgi:ABC-type branched-subunit amino acid transport system ATPase component
VIVLAYLVYGLFSLQENQKILRAEVQQVVQKLQTDLDQIKAGQKTAFQNIRIGILSKRGVRFNMFRNVDKMEDITRETDELLKRINLYDVRGVPAGNLPYGQQRSLEISMALATDPDLVMLDEPTAGMSKDETHYAVELIRKLTKGKTVVIIEHDMDVVFSLADRITVLHMGTILASGPPNEIRENQAIKDAYHNVKSRKPKAVMVEGKGAPAIFIERRLCTLCEVCYMFALPGYYLR